MRSLLRLINKLFKIFAWVLGILIVLLFCFYLWFNNNAEKTVENLVFWQSQGKLKASVKKLRIDYFNNKVEIKEITFYNTDTLRKGASIRFTANKLRFTILSKSALVFHQQLLIDTIIFTAPVITVTNRGTAIKDTSKKQLPLVEQLGTVYESINQGLTVLNLKCFKIIEGKVIVKDALDTTGKPPLLLSHIFFAIDNPHVGKTNSDGKISYAPDVMLRLAAQKIILNDKKGGIGFNELLIDSKQRLIQVLQPVIDLNPSGDNKNSFNSTAERLAISGLDFNLLYTKSLIQIDSIYALNPKGDLQLFAKNEKKIEPVKKKQTLQETLGSIPIAININHVAIINSNTSLHLNQAGKTSLFQTKNNDISLTDIRINEGNKNGITIHGFKYTLRNFSGFTPDSIHRCSFDSLQFIDNKIVLFNFNIATSKSKESIASVIRNHTIPRFEIIGMDWTEFILHNHFAAEKAVLYNPIFNVIKKSTGKVKSSSTLANEKSVFETLSVFDSLIDLNEMRFVNGQFNFKQGNDIDLHLKKLNWYINTNELTKAKSSKEVMHAVKELSFDTAIASLPGVTMRIAATKFINSGKSLLIKNIQFGTADKNTSVNLTGLVVNDLSVETNKILADGIAWKEGSINISTHPKTAGVAKPAGNNFSFILNNISANNTRLIYDNTKLKLGLFLRMLSVNSVSKEGSNPIKLKGFAAAGENVHATVKNGRLQCSEFTIKDEQQSIFKNVFFEQKTNSDTVKINIPAITFTPFLNKTLATNAIFFNDIAIHAPDLYFATETKTKLAATKNLPINLPLLHINGFLVQDGILHFSSFKANARTVVDCKLETLALHSIESQANKSLLINNIALISSSIDFNKNDSTIIKSSGNLQLALSKISFDPATKNWQAKIDKLLADKINYTSLQADKRHTNLLINKFNLRDAALANAVLKEPLPWLINKSSAVVSLGFIHFQNNNTNLQATNFLFNGNKKHIGIDSVSMDPGQTTDNFMARLTTRKDYMAVSTGKIALDGLSYQNKLFRIENINSTNAKLFIYSNKLIPADADSDGIKPLITSALKNISAPVQVDKIGLKNMEVVYSELNADTKHLGSLNFTNIYGNVSNILSTPNLTSDSLRINIYTKFLDTMRLHLMMSESYNDPLNGFRFQLQLGHGDMRLLNSFLGPLVSLKIPSGYLDSMSLSANANDRIAAGKMRLYYHKLKAQILDAGGVDHPKFKTKFLNILANSLVIKNKNNKRQASFTFYRDRQKSIISYLLKMVVQGSGGNVAPGISKIIFKKQNKKLEARNALTIKGN